MSAQSVDSPTPGSVLVIACGALAPELVALQKLNHWNHLEFKCLPAEYHNTPTKILPELKQLVDENRGLYEQIFIGYSDCGTGGQLDQYIEEEQLERLPGAHCYEMFAGSDLFAQLHQQELGTFYLTDYLARNFTRLIIEGLKIDKHPELLSMYFGSYKRLVYLTQTNNEQYEQNAREAAEFLGLQYEKIHTGMGLLNDALQVKVINTK